MTPAIYHRSPIGIFVILFVTAVLTGFFSLAYYYQLPKEPTLAHIFLSMAFLSLVAGLERFIAYVSSKLVITDQTLRVVYYKTVFAPLDAETEWARVQDANVQTTGIFAAIFDYGTLLIQTAGATNTFKFYTLPSPSVVQQQILTLVEKAATNVKVV